MRKNGYQQVSFMGLEEYKKKGYKLIYPKEMKKD